MLDLIDRLQQVFEEEKYIQPTELDVIHQALVKELASIVRKLDRIKVQLETFKGKKKELEPEIIKKLEELDKQGIRVGKILLYVRSQKQIPSFKRVYEKVKSELSPEVQKLLEETYKQLIKELGKSISYKVESVQEDWRDWVMRVKDFFRRIFDPFLRRISGVIDSIENLLEVKK